MAAAISSARAEYVLQMIVTTSHGVTRAIIDDPGQATELVRNRAGATMSEAAVREVSGPVRKYESRTVNFAAGTWSSRYSWLPRLGAGRPVASTSRAPPRR